MVADSDFELVVTRTGAPGHSSSLVAERLSIPQLKGLERFMVKVRRHPASAPCN
jgi:hypothetical protein